MSNTVEDQIVAMHFDNKQFESGVSQSLGTIDKLKSAMSFSGAGKGIDEINRSVSGFNMNPMSTAIEGISGKFLALSTVAVTAISNITNKVVDSALKMGKSLVVDPFTQGFAEYSTNLNSIQTIIANTGAKLPAVNKVLQQLNTYSDKTIYNFGQMAQNIGRFTAAGVAMGPAVDAIKGMANTAALSGATAEQLNSAMYQMSQALSTGVIRLMDWNSLANANMGGQNIQKALQATAEAGDDAGKAMHDAVEKNGNFRDSLTEGWLTGDIFTKTMKVMAGQLDKTTGGYKAFTVAQLQGMGYSAEAAKELNRLSAASIDAATKVKTISQAYDVVKESIGSGWALVFQNIFGNFNQSKTLWTGVTKYITDAVGNVFGALNKVLLHWNKMGGRDAIIGGLKQAFKDLLRFFIPIKNAFKEVFPPATGDFLIKISKTFQSFFGLFRLNVKTMHVIREVFVAIFTAIKFGFSLIGYAISLFKTFFGLFSGGGTGDFVSFFTNGAKTVTNFFKKIQSSGKVYLVFRRLQSIVIELTNALKPLGAVFKSVAKSAGNLAAQGADIAGNLIAGILQGFNATDLENAIVGFANNIVTWIQDALGIHSPAETMIPIGVNIVLGIAQGMEDAGPHMVEGLQKIFTAMATGISLVFEGLGQLVKDALTNMDLESFLQIVNTILFGGFLREFTRFTGSFTNISKSITKAIDTYTGSLKAMQSKIKSEVIRNIALSVLMLAGAAKILASIDSEKLKAAMLAIGGMMAAMFGAMKILLGGNTKDITGKGVAKQGAQLIAVSTSLVGFATAILILSGAVKVLGSMDPEVMKQGLEGVAGIVAGIVAATAILGKTGGGASIFGAAAALLILSVALVAFVGTMEIYAKLDWNTIIVGGGKAALVIFAVGLAMSAFSKYAVSGSVGLLIASAALLIMAKALQKFAAIDPEKMGNALVALVVTLGAVALAGGAMEGGAVGLLAGAAAMLGIAYAFKILAKIPADKLAKAIVIIGLAFVALAIAAEALTPAIPVMVAFGSAALAVGAGIALAGLGVLAFATALGIIAVVGPAAFQALSDGALLLADTFSNTLVIFSAAAGVFIVLGAAGIVAGAGLTVLSVAIVIFSASLIVFAAAVTITSVSLLILAGAISALRHSAAPSIQDVIDAFHKLMDIKQTLDNLKNIVGDWIDKQIQKIKDGASALKTAMGELIQSMKDKVTGWKDDMSRWGSDIGTNLIQGIVDGLENAWHWVQEKIDWISDHIPKWMRDKMGITSPSKVMRDEVGQWVAKGVAEGISKHTSSAETASKDLADRSLEAMRYAFNNSKQMGNSLRDIRPKITPVLDLAELNKQASQIGGSLSGQHMIKTGLSGRKAQDISGLEGRRRADEVASINETYTFNQTINSPKAVNKVDVYRGTKSQFALFKEVKGQ